MKKEEFCSFLLKAPQIERCKSGGFVVLSFLIEPEAGLTGMAFRRTAKENMPDLVRRNGGKYGTALGRTFHKGDGSSCVSVQRFHPF